MTEPYKAFIFAGPKLLTGECFSLIDFDGGLLIAADCGLQNAELEGITPDVVIGDFDSYDKPTTGEVITYPVEKDDTDTMLCARYAVGKGATEVTVISGVGGRLDHTISNIQTLAFLLDNGCKGRIASDDTEIWLLDAGKYEFVRREGWSVSLFSYTDRVEDLTLTGFKYNVDGFTLTSGFPIGASNSILSQSAAVEFSSGRLLVISSRL